MKGSISRYRDKWRAHIDIPGKDGRQQKTKVGDSKKELERWLIKMNYQLNEQIYFEPSETPTAEYLDDWLERRKNTIKTKTMEKYQYAVDKIKAVLGPLPLKNLTIRHIEQFYNKLSLSNSTIRTIASVFKTALNSAVREKMIKENPVKDARCPKKENKEMNYLTSEEVNVFLKSTEGSWPYHALFWLAVNTGLRRGELLGLKWDDINFEAQTLTVNRQLIRKEGYEFEFTSPKTESARRTIHLNDTTINKLKTHRKKQLEFRMKAEQWEENNLVFSNKKGSFVRPAALRGYLNRRLKKAGLKRIRFHDLRHTCASLLLSRGIDPQTVSNMLGHSRTSTTMDIYGHLMPGNKKEIGQAMEALLK